AEEKGVSLDLLRLARHINDQMPAFLVDQVDRWVRDKGKEPRDVTVAVLGIAMKDYSSDDRISPPLKTVELLQQAGYRVKAFDPAVQTSYPFKVEQFEEAVTGADVILIL